MMDSQQTNKQQEQQHSGLQGQNRYAHLISGGKQPTVVSSTNVPIKSTTQVINTRTPTTFSTTITPPSVSNNIYSSINHSNNKIKPPPLGSAANNQQNRAAGGNYYYNSFSTVDWKEQFIIMKDKLLEKAEEPQNQRKLILFIVCCALLLDNMLYMVIVPIIPDYLRSIGSWSTYTENAKWIRRNSTPGHGGAKWERVGGQVVYEGEDSAVGFLFASKAIVQLFINPFSGAIIDRIGYEIPMMIGLTVMFFSTMVFACGQTYSILFLARSLQGVGSAFADTSGLAMIADRFTEENERQRALGVALAFISFGCLVAPPFGSVLYQAAGKEVPFIILSLVCLLDGSLLLLVTPPGTFVQLLPNRADYDYRNKEQTRPDLRRSEMQQSQSGGKQQLVAQTSITSSVSEIASEQQKQIVSERDPEQKRAIDKKNALKRQKSISRRQSMKVASAGEAPKGTPIYILFKDPYIACCSGALVIANVSLAFLEPTISIWVQNTMPDIEEWQMGMIWLPAFVPHVLGVYSTVKLADKYPKYQWLIAAIGLILEGLSCLMVPFCSSFWSLIIPISIICFGLALIDTAILPTLGFLVDTRYVSVYGSIYAIADISYSLSYAIGPIIAGGIVEAIGFTALNFLIAIVTLGYTPILVMLRTIHDYEPFEADNTGMKKVKAKELAPFGQFGRQPVEDSDEISDCEFTQQQQQQVADQQQSIPANATTRYESPRWAASKQGSITTSAWNDDPTSQQQVVMKPALTKKASLKVRGREDSRARHSVKIVEDVSTLDERENADFQSYEPIQDESATADHFSEDQQEDEEEQLNSGTKNPFLAGE